MPRTTANKHKLNRRYLRSLKPKEHPFLVWDTDQRGLVIQVQPSGYRAWKCIYKFGGRARWYHVADASAINLADARKLVSQIMYRVAQGQDPAAERRATRGADTFEELAARYKEYSKRKNKSWQQAERLVRRHLLPRWAKLRAADIARADVKAMMARIDAPIAANQTLAAASAIFGWAIKEEMAGIKINPCAGVERNETKSRDRVLSDGEIPKFWDAFTEAGWVTGNVLKMILLTGQRSGEVCSMRIEHIEDGWWTLPGEPVAKLGWPGTKNAATHRVWLPAPAQGIIAKMEGSGFVFEGARVPALGVAMRKICAALKLEMPARPHDLRRTHGSTITALGFGRDAMNRIQNHKEGGIASVYDRHQYAEENKRIMETVTARIMALAEGRATSNVIEARFR